MDWINYIGSFLIIVLFSYILYKEYKRRINAIQKNKNSQTTNLENGQSN